VPVRSLADDRVDAAADDDDLLVRLRMRLVR
jgi:hypothetical protein